MLFELNDGKTLIEILVNRFRLSLLQHFNNTGTKKDIEKEIPLAKHYMSFIHVPHVNVLRQKLGNVSVLNRF